MLNYRLLPLMLAISLIACSESGDNHSSGDAPGSGPDAQAQQSGAELTRKHCGSCHYLEDNLNKIGPSLKGIVGRAPSISGIPYMTWDEQALDEWMENPGKIKPGTRMAIPGVKSAQKRAAIIEYLKQL